MTQRVRVPENVLSLDFQDGTSYASKNGFVEVSDHHAPYIKRSVAGQMGVINPVPATGFSSLQGKSCTCGFEAFIWQTLCPRCSSLLSPQ